MAIQVTDPRNNLLSQLTAVGQQYLAGKQQERATALDFENRKALLDLIAKQNETSGAREFQQTKELEALRQANALGLLNATGAQRLSELVQEGRNQQGVEATRGEFMLRAAEAGRPPNALESLPAVLQMLRGNNEPSAGTGPDLTPDVVKAFVDLGDKKTLGILRSGLNDKQTLETLLSEIESNPVGAFMRSPFSGGKSVSVATDFLRNRINYLNQRASQVEASNLNRSDLAGAAQIIQAPSFR